MTRARCYVRLAGFQLQKVQRNAGSVRRAARFRQPMLALQGRDSGLHLESRSPLRRAECFCSKALAKQSESLAEIHERLDADLSILGRWCYHGYMSYTISMNENGQYQFDEHGEGMRYRHHGILEKHDEWFEGWLMDERSQRVGSIRLRYDNSRNVVISQCKSADASAVWEPELVAYLDGDERIGGKASFRENAMPLCVAATLTCTVAFLCWEYFATLSWRRTIRPIFYDWGLDEYADRLESFWNGFWQKD
eukprot:TRINITY_DN34590_c0_g1_i1.p1 TRINITY_DN34590_c0_g1~~TRINITY_DN34590_c0_g1_i1.p1  ORF type:complete len:266 (-),score=27.30 TRINITY_DN34590_c0_g1_i1:99-851(-)